MKRTHGSPTSTSKSKSPSPIALKKAKTVDVQHEAAADGSADWTKVERRKVKKQKKTEAKHDANPPRFMYSKGDITKRKDAVGIEEIRDLVLHILADAPPPRWVKVENPHAISKVVALMIPGLTHEVLCLPPLPTTALSNPNLPLSIPLPTDAVKAAVPFITETFSHALPTRAPGDQNRMHSVLSAFFQGPVTGAEQKKRKEQRLKSERLLSKDPAQYVLTIEEMIENDYPIPSYIADVFEKPPGWVETPPPDPSIVYAEGSTQTTKVYAVDCEMCLTEQGKELARVCLIDYHSGIVVYDRLVKPPRPVIDYLTRWSGITAEVLEPVTTILPTVQAHLLRLLSCHPTPILLGHSLESDLKALKLCHPRCIDTAVIFHHPRGRPLKPGLAWLTKKWCQREIQTRGDGGHDPEEDARACLDLLKKKVENGPGFGEFKTDYESIFERIGRSVGRGPSGSTRSAVVDHGNPAVMHGSKAQTSIACTNDEEVMEGVVQVIETHDFAFGRFLAIANAMGWSTPKSSTDTLPLPPPMNFPTISLSELQPLLTTLSNQLSTLYHSLPPRTAVLIFTGHSDPRRMASLNARKNAFDVALKGGKSPDQITREMWWTSALARELEEEVERVKRGLLFLGIK